MELFLTWQFNLIGYLICVVAYFQFYKLAVKNAEEDGAATLLLQTIAGLSVLLLVPFFEFKLPSDIKWYLLLIAASVFYTVNDRLQTTARKHLQVSVFTILNQLANVFLIIFGLTIFKESFSFSKILGAGLILLANGLLLYKKGRLEINKYVFITIAATLSFAIAISIDIGIVQQFNLPFYIMLALIIPAAMLFFVEKISLHQMFVEYKNSNGKYYLLTGVFWALTIFFSLRSFQFGEVTTIVPLQATNVLLNVAVAYLFLGEKKEELKKIIAALIIIAGIYLTVI